MRDSALPRYKAKMGTPVIGISHTHNPFARGELTVRVREVSPHPSGSLMKNEATGDMEE